MLSFADGKGQIIFSFKTFLTLSFAWNVVKLSENIWWIWKIYYAVVHHISYQRLSMVVLFKYFRKIKKNKTQNQVSLGHHLRKFRVIWVFKMPQNFILSKVRDFSLISHENSWIWKFYVMEMQKKNTLNIMEIRMIRSDIYQSALLTKSLLGHPKTNHATESKFCDVL